MGNREKRQESQKTRCRVRNQEDRRAGVSSEQKSTFNICIKLAVRAGWEGRREKRFSQERHAEISVQGNYCLQNNDSGFKHICLGFKESSKKK